MMRKDASIVSNPTIAQVMRALAEASFCLSPSEVTQLMPPHAMNRMLTITPAIRNIFIALLRIFSVISVPGVGREEGGVIVLPLIERERSFIIHRVLNCSTFGKSIKGSNLPPSLKLWRAGKCQMSLVKCHSSIVK